MAWDHGGNPFFDSLRGDSAAEITAYWDKPCGVYGPLGEPELIVGEALKRETIRVTPQ